MSGPLEKSVASRRSTRAIKYSNQATLVWSMEGDGRGGERTEGGNRRGEYSTLVRIQYNT